MSIRKWGVWAGVLAAVLAFSAGCPQPTTTTTGDAAAGQADFNSICSGCHTAATIAPARGLIRTNMGSINPAMSAITLTTQHVADLQSFLATQ